MIEHPFHGIDCRSDPPWRAAVSLGEGTVEVLVGGEGADDFSREWLNTVGVFVTELEGVDQKARDAMLRLGAEPDSEVEEYRQHCLIDLTAEQLRATSGSDRTQFDLAVLVSSLRLLRVRIRPARTDAVLDYSIGAEMTDNLLALQMSADGVVGWIRGES